MKSELFESIGKVSLDPIKSLEGPMAIPKSSPIDVPLLSSRVATGKAAECQSVHPA